MSVNSNPWNPSAVAISKVKDPLPKPIFCNCCGGDVRIAGHGEVYGKCYGKYPWVYLCDSCGAYVGMHPFTDLPLGTLAGLETRKARNYSKRPFEKIWRDGYMTRNEAYQWLSEKLAISKKDCHFGMFDEQTCKKAYVFCLEYLGAYNG